MMTATTPQPQTAMDRITQAPTDGPLRAPKGRADDTTDPNGSLRRKSSLNFLRRAKSRDRSASTGSAPHRKLSKKEVKRMREEEARRMRDSVPARPPRIPAVPSQPQLQTFGGEGARMNNPNVMSNRYAGNYAQRLAQKASQEALGADFYRGMPIPPVPPVPPIPGGFHDMSRPESMANRGRYSYASSAISTINSPRRVRRRKDPTPFNILVIGPRGSGKTSFLRFLQTSLALPPAKQRAAVTRDDFDLPLPASEAAFSHFQSKFVETEIDLERVGVTLWDSEGLEKNVVDLQLREITSFIESKFEDTFTEESKVSRAPGFRDTHIHCVFMMLDPMRLDANIAADQTAKMVNGVRARANSFSKARLPDNSPLSGLDENLDLNVLRTLKGKTTVIPIISKADTVTKAHMEHLKGAVYASLKENGLDTLEALEAEDDYSDSETSTEPSRTFDDADDDLHGKENEKPTPNTDPDKFSVTSHLESSSESSAGSDNYELAPTKKPVQKESPARIPITPQAPVAEQHLLPLSIISPDPYEPEVIGRKFAWGFADPNNADHCDFLKLRQHVFREWRGDLREASRDLWYEGWRTSRLNRKNKRNGVSLEGTKVFATPGQAQLQASRPWMQ